MASLARTSGGGNFWSVCWQSLHVLVIHSTAGTTGEKTMSGFLTVLLVCTKLTRINWPAFVSLICTHFSLLSPLKTFRDQGMSDYIVCYMRLLTSGYLQSHAGFYEAFLDGIDSVKSFCSTVSWIKVSKDGYVACSKDGYVACLSM